MSKCKTCQSERCGNHAACARKAQDKRESNFGVHNWHSKDAMNTALSYVEWNMFMAIMYLEMRKAKRLDEAAELAEFRYFQKHEPGIYACLKEIAHQRWAKLEELTRLLFLGI